MFSRDVIAAHRCLCKLPRVRSQIQKAVASTVGGIPLGPSLQQARCPSNNAEHNSLQLRCCCFQQWQLAKALAIIKLEASSCNAHAGLAAAERLGAPYPFAHDPLASKQFQTYFKLAHGMFARRRKQ